MKNLLFLQESLPFHGGAPQKLYRLARRLPPGPIHVGSLRHTPDSILPRLAETGASVVEFGSNNLILLAGRVRRYLRAHEIRAVFALSFRAYCVAKAAARGLGCKTVFWASDLTLTRKPLKYRLFRLLSGGDWILGGCQALLQAHAAPGHARSALLYNGVDAPRAMERRQARRELQLPEDDPILLYAADCLPIKDHRTLFRAFKILAARHERLRLILCGRTGALPEEAADPIILGPEALRRVHFFGPRDDMYRFFAAADIYVHPCYLEAFGNAAVEAMLAGLPVVAAATGGLPEIIGEGGLFFEPRNPEALAAALEDLLADEAGRATLAERGRRRALREYRPEAFAENFMGLCRRILEED